MSTEIEYETVKKICKEKDAKLFICKTSKYEASALSVTMWYGITIAKKERLENLCGKHFALKCAVMFAQDEIDRDKRLEKVDFLSEETI